MKKDLPIGLVKSVLLFCIALVLFVLTTPFGFIYAVLRQTLFKKGILLQVYCIEVALALDNAGNVMMQFILNDSLLIEGKHTYYFGNKKETISSVIGKNSLTQTLSPWGKKLNAFLNWIDKDHSFNAIMYDLRRFKEQKKAA